MKSQGSAPEAHKTLQSQNRPSAGNRLSVNDLTVVHGRLMRMAIALLVLVIGVSRTLADDAFQILPLTQSVGFASESGTAIVLNTANGNFYSCVFGYSTRPPFRVTNKQCTRGTVITGSDPFPTGYGAMFSTAAPVTTSPIIWKINEGIAGLVACGSFPNAPIATKWICASIPLPK
jgi:hypothetical protein